MGSLSCPSLCLWILSVAICWNCSALGSPEPSALAPSGPCYMRSNPDRGDSKYRGSREGMWNSKKGLVVGAEWMRAKGIGGRGQRRSPRQDHAGLCRSGFGAYVFILNRRENAWRVFSEVVVWSDLHLKKTTLLEENRWKSLRPWVKHSFLSDSIENLDPQKQILKTGLHKVKNFCSLKNIV